MLNLHYNLRFTSKDELNSNRVIVIALKCFSFITKKIEKSKGSNNKRLYTELNFIVLKLF